MKCDTNIKGSWTDKSISYNNIRAVEASNVTDKSAFHKSLDKVFD